MCDEDKISKYNREVTNNWKLLSRGKLEISPDYENHLKSGYKTLSISSGLKNLAEQEIMIELEKKVSALPKPAIPGEFTSIIIDYNKNLAKKREEEQAELEQTVIDVPNLFADNTIPGTPEINEIGPYAGTALLATNINLRREKNMDMETFKQKYLRTDKNHLKNSKSDEDPNPLRKKYLQWVEKEQKKSKFASKNVPKIKSEEVHDIVSSMKNESSREPINKFAKISRASVPYKLTNYQPSSEADFINIPEDVKHQYKTFQVGDTVYDRDGQFLYRLPTMSN